MVEQEAWQEFPEVPWFSSQVAADQQHSGSYFTTKQGALLPASLNTIVKEAESRVLRFCQRASVGTASNAKWLMFSHIVNLQEMLWSFPN